MKRFGELAAVVLACVLGMGLAACGRSQVIVPEGSSANSITVTASAEAKVAPDKATFYTEVMAQAATAKEAQATGAETTNAVIAALKAAGVDEKDIQTNYTNVSPIYDWTSEESTITGYEMRTSLRVSGVDLDNVASLMETCVAAGASSVNGPEYYVSSYDDVYAQALADAMAASKPKAEAIAKAAGVSLGEVISVTEGYQATGYRYLEKTNVAGGEAIDSELDEVSLDIAPGEVAIEAQVTVSYSIR